MEHQTMSFMGGFNYELMAHELLHQWYGDAVTCGSWRDIGLTKALLHITQHLTTTISSMTHIEVVEKRCR